MTILPLFFDPFVWSKWYPIGSANSKQASLTNIELIYDHSAVLRRQIFRKQNKKLSTNSSELTWHPPPLQRASQTSHLAASLTRGNPTASVWRTVQGENEGSEGVARSVYKKNKRKITQSQWWSIINDHIHWLKDFPGPISSTHSQDITRTLHRLHCSSTVSLESICSSSLQQRSAAKLERCVVTSSTSRGRQIIKDSSVLQKVPINVCTGQFSISFRLFVFHCVSRKTERICNIWLYFSNHHNNAWSRRKRLPVYDIIGFFCADDTESVHSSIGRCKVGMLSWSPCKTSGWALTASQELAHAGDEG